MSTIVGVKLHATNCISFVLLQVFSESLSLSDASWRKAVWEWDMEEGKEMLLAPLAELKELSQ